MFAATVSTPRRIIAGTVNVVGSLWVEVSSHYSRIKSIWTYDAKQLDQLKAVVVVLVVKLRLPVVALVQGLVTSSVLRVARIVVAHGHVVTSASDDGVDVGAELAGTDDGIGTLHCQRLAVHDEEAALGSNQGSSSGNNKKRSG